MTMNQHIFFDKYNSLNGGPASGMVTHRIETKATELFQNNLQSVKRIPFWIDIGKMTGKEFFIPIGIKKNKWKPKQKQLPQSL